MDTILHALSQQEDARNNLSKLAERLRDMSVEWKLTHGEQYAGVLLPYLKHEDAKVRKNCAKVLGHFPMASICDALMEAYRNENVMFVRSQYLSALCGCELGEYRSELEARRESLIAEEITDENRKHVNEELRAIEACFGERTGMPQTYTGEKVPSDVLLVTNPLYTKELYDMLGQDKKKVVGGGVLVHCEDLKEVRSIRLFREMLFVIPGLQTVEEDPYRIAARLASEAVMRFLKKRHTGGDSFSYRIELRSNMDERKKSLFLKRLNGEILRLMGGRLRNDSGNYDVEFRLIQREGGYRLLVKLMTLKDTRFAYRRESVAASIQPTDVAFCLQAFQQYLQEDAQVLDPFCGVGTMLLERAMYGNIKIAFGVDTFGEAIEKARKNTEAAHAPVHYIQRDFFDFRHETLFDEIITNMPFHKDFEDDKVEYIYEKFFQKAMGHWKPTGVMLLVSHNPSLVKKYLPDTLEIAERVVLREKLPMEAYLIQRR